MSTSENRNYEPYDNNDTFSITQWIELLLDDWISFVIPMLLVIFLAIVYLLTVIPTYKAEGIIQVTTEDDNPAVGALVEMSGMTATSPAETEVEILGSRKIITDAAHRLNLNLSMPVSGFTLNYHISLFGHSPTNKDLAKLRQIISSLTIEDWNEAPVDAIFETLKDGHLKVVLNNKKKIIKKGETFYGHGISFKYDGINKNKAVKKITVTIIPDDRIYDDLKKNLSIRTIGDRKATNLVKISFVYKDRLIAKRFINSIMNSYMSFALNWRTEQAEKRADFIEHQIVNVRKSLEKTESTLQNFLEENGAILLPEQAKTLIEESSTLSVDMQKLEIQEDMMKKISFDINNASLSGKDSGVTGGFLSDDPVLGQDIASLHQLQLKKESMLADFTPRHPGVIKLNREISRVRDQINHYIKTSRKQIIQHQKGIDSALSDIQEHLAGFPKKERALATLRRNQDVDQRMYVFLLTKLEESRIIRASTTTDKRIIDIAYTPYKKQSPARVSTLLSAILAGFLLGILIVYAKRILDPRVQDEEEAKNITNLPIHGVIPDISTLGFTSSDIPVIKQIWKFPKGPAAEAFRTLKTNVEFSKTREHNIKVIQITSSEASEGKSTVISNLAIALAKGGNKVLLADLDLRRPTQHRIWSVPRSPGISDFLAGHKDLTTHKIDEFAVTVVTAGYDPPESQRLLSSDTLAKQILKWREDYDYVLLDTSPLLIADSLVISKLGDLMLFAVRPKKCKKSALKLAVNSYLKTDIIKGLIINGSATRKGGYYHYYRGSYYGEKTSDTQEQS